MRIFEHHGKWYLDYRWNGKRYRYPVSETKRVADTAAANVTIQMAAGTFKGPSRKDAVPEQDAGGATVKRLCDEFLEVRKAKTSKATGEFYEDHLDHIKRFFGERTFVRDVTPRDCERFLAKRRRGTSPATVNRAHYVLQAMFRTAVAWEWVPVSPAQRLRKLKERPRERFLTPEEARAVLDHADPWVRPILETFLYTGARRGDLLGHPGRRKPLRWESVDLKKGFLEFRDTKEGRTRRLPMCPALIATLKPLGSRFPRGPVFLDDAKQPAKPERVLDRFKAAAKKAGVKDWDKLRLHDLRHTAASWMVQNGVPLFEVARVLGHHTIQMTERYSHFASEHLTGAVSTLAGALGRSSEANG